MTRRLVAVETTTRVTGVALFEDGELALEVEREGRGDVLLVLVDELLGARGLSPRDVQRWAVDIGPGSFTGVRVGLATVKGIAFATGAEVVGVNAFDALTTGSESVLLDAGKGEVYHRVDGEMGHAPLDALRARLREPVIGPGVLPRARGVGRAALGRAADDVDRLVPLYVRPPDLTRPA